MAVEEEVVVKAEEAPVQFKGSVKFEIKKARAAPTRPALDAFSQIEDIVEAPPPRVPVARPKPTAPVEVVEPPVIDCAGGDRRRNHIWGVSCPWTCGVARRWRPTADAHRRSPTLGPVEPTGTPTREPPPGRRRRDPRNTQAATAAGWPSRTRSRPASSSPRRPNLFDAPSCYEAAVLR